MLARRVAALSATSDPRTPLGPSVVSQDSLLPFEPARRRSLQFGSVPADEKALLYLTPPGSASPLHWKRKFNFNSAESVR